MSRAPFYVALPDRWHDRERPTDDQIDAALLILDQLSRLYPEDGVDVQGGEMTFTDHGGGCAAMHADEARLLAAVLALVRSRRAIAETDALTLRLVGEGVGAQILAFKARGSK